MSDVTTVLFDLDDTICTYTQDGCEVLSAAFDRVGVEQFFDARDWARVMAEGVGSGTESQLAFYDATFTALAERAGRDPDLGSALADAYRAERDYAAVRPLPGVERTLDHLHGDYRLGIVTNGGPDIQPVKLDALGYDHYFETVVCPGNGVRPKPETDAFERALGSLDATPDEAIHVGNSLPADVGGANAAGVRSAWVPYGNETTAGRPKPTHRLTSVLGVRDLV